jgi:hypothetical protein
MNSIKELEEGAGNMVGTGRVYEMGQKIRYMMCRGGGVGGQKTKHSPYL